MYTQNNIMDFILKNIGQNKVNVPIVSNEYEETQPYMEEQSKFDEIENIIDIYKSSNKVSKTVSVKKILLSSFNSLMYCILEFIDNTISLHSDDFKLEKVEQFKKQLNSKIDLGPKKVFGYGRDSYHEFLENEDKRILNWICYFLNKTIVLKSNIADIILFGTEEGCIVIEENIHSQYILSNSKDLTSKWKTEKKKLLALKYTPEKLNSMLVKDLKEVAKELDISLFKIEDGKKKNYLKNDLKDMIVQFLQ